MKTNLIDAKVECGYELERLKNVIGKDLDFNLVYALVLDFNYNYTYYNYYYNCNEGYGYFIIVYQLKDDNSETLRIGSLKPWGELYELDILTCNDSVDDNAFIRQLKDVIMTEVEDFTKGVCNHVMYEIFENNVRINENNPH